METLKKSTLWMLAAAYLPLSAPAAAADAFSAPRETVSDGLKQEQNAVESQQKQWFESIASKPEAVSAEKTPPKNIPVYSNEDLIARPELMHGLMAQALNSGDLHLIESLMAVYRKQPQADPVLLARAEAETARLKGQYGRAIETYRSMRQARPNDPRIALDTAATLFEDKQWKESDRLFAEVAADPALPEAVRNNIHTYRQAAANTNRWQFNAQAGISHDTNINDAAPAYCLPLGCIEQKAENATGIHYRLSAEKNTPLKGRHNLLFRSHMNGVSYYLDKKSQYDHAFGRAYLGWQYQSARTSIHLLPFYQWQLAGTDEWSRKPERNHTLKMDMLAHAGGFQTAFTHQISPRLHSFVSAETYRLHYRETERAERNNGRQDNLYASLAYRLTPTQTVFGGLGGGRFRTDRSIVAGRENNAGNTRRTLSGGWIASWPQLGGLNTQFRTAHTQRRYRGQALDTDFYWQTQRNRETSFSLSAAHPKLSFRKLTPKLTWEHQRIRSTHKWADLKQNRLFIELEKDF